jgi:hypothetical protein
MVARVFHMKLDEYLEDIREGHVFGPVCAGLCECACPVPILSHSIAIHAMHCFLKHVT